jgi:hypothetical protein
VKSLLIIHYFGHIYILLRTPRYVQVERETLIGMAHVYSASNTLCHSASISIGRAYLPINNGSLIFWLARLMFKLRPWLWVFSIFGRHAMRPETLMWIQTLIAGEGSSWLVMKLHRFTPCPVQMRGFSMWALPPWCLSSGLSTTSWEAAVTGVCWSFGLSGLVSPAQDGRDGQHYYIQTCSVSIP